jgi:hypothetical protein
MQSKNMRLSIEIQRHTGNRMQETGENRSRFAVDYKQPTLCTDTGRDLWSRVRWHSRHSEKMAAASVSPAPLPP